MGTTKYGNFENVNHLAECTLEGKWDEVDEMYNKFPACHTATIDDFVGTALHVAVDLAEEVVVEKLVNAIMRHETMEALEMRNDRGDTALHVAASRGFTKICQIIVGENRKRIYLAKLKNKDGETPFFQAALNWKKQAFAYLSDHSATLQDLVRENGDSILHCAIRREYFDLAVIIVHYYDFLSIHLNKEGFTPLKVLATRPSAFRSATKLSWWKQILYHCMIVEPVIPDRQMEKILKKMENKSNDSKCSYPDNYTTLCEFIAGFKSLGALPDKFCTIRNEQDSENPSIKESKNVGFLPPNYETSQQFLRSAYVHTLGLTGVGLKEIRNMKRRHEWSGQLLKALLKRPYEAFTGYGGAPDTVDEEMYNVFNQLKPGESSKLPWLNEEGEEEEKEEEEDEEEEEEEEETEKEEVVKEKEEEEDKQKQSSRASDSIDKTETAFLVAARNGIIEMVNELLERIPSVIHNLNANKENVLLMAVMNRQPYVIENLKMKVKGEVWNNLTLAIDKNERTILHWAADAPGDGKHTKIAGSALQMMWDIKWFQYIKSLVPEHFYLRSDTKGKTAGQIFEDEHKDLIEKSSDWLKETSESCSVVAALVAGVSFATASSIPGGTDDKGRPHLEGEPAFDVFAVSSLVGLCTSVTGLIMFLTILTSRKQSKDFRRNLPFKLLLGLSSLFVSIAAMFVSFCSGHYFLLSHRYKSVLYPIYAATVFPVMFYAVAQFPLYFDLIIAILSKVPWDAGRGDNL
ncbi:uncharacterized protein LOC108336456 isoform X2 [Vigna angularis]|uniref:uncharacterized protein LOC108336456 isoform X2 n=1 Tax=Phaseolus angularis TaxID=3914 RepID=UPI00080A02C2|nr:uncharacterized protein LOC108336456 isoform X2 [Vigna angularis]